MFLALGQVGLSAGGEGRTWWGRELPAPHPGQPQPHGDHPTASSSPSLHAPQGMQRAIPYMDPRALMCPWGSLTPLHQPAVSPRAPMGISDQPGAPSVPHGNTHSTRSPSWLCSPAQKRERSHPKERWRLDLIGLQRRQRWEDSGPHLQTYPSYSRVLCSARSPDTFPFDSRESSASQCCSVKEEEWRSL